ncbi:MAG: NAD(P)/FAD-dependent oxidoreductase [Planctomycetota bacterium]
MTDNFDSNFERRKFLQGLLSAAAAASLPGAAIAKPISSSRGQTGPGEKPVVIIGAGMAGLSAARALHDCGRSVVVLEARNRTGGRTFTDKVGEGVVDLGGSWIHGVGDTPLRLVIEAAGLEYSPHYLDPDGFYDASIEARPNNLELFQVLAAFEAFNPRSLDIAEDPTASVADGLDEFIENLALDEVSSGRIRFGLEALYSAGAGRMDKQALNPAEADWPYENSFGEVDGTDFVVKGGYKMLVDFLSMDLDIRLECPVSLIEYGDEGVVVHCGNETVEASHVIVTVPLGVLKEGTITFEPALPEEKQGAIERIGFGTFEKVILNFDRDFWGDAINVTSYYAGLGAERAWPFFFDMSEFAGSPTLICIYAGHFAQVAQDTLDDEQIVAEVIKAVEQMAGEPAPAPVASRVTRWRSDAFSRGSYSFVSVDTKAGDADLLAAPVGERLFFAGEATSSFMHSTVDGAVLSGLREANRIEPAATLPGIPES